MMPNYVKIPCRIKTARLLYHYPNSLGGATQKVTPGSFQSLFISGNCFKDLSNDVRFILLENEQSHFFDSKRLVKHLAGCYLGEISLPCCMKAPKANQRLFLTEK